MTCATVTSDILNSLFYRLTNSVHLCNCNIQWNLGIKDTQGTVKNCLKFWGGLISQVHFYVLNRPRDWSSCPYILGCPYFSGGLKSRFNCIFLYSIGDVYNKLRTNCRLYIWHIPYEDALWVWCVKFLLQAGVSAGETRPLVDDWPANWSNPSARLANHANVSACHKFSFMTVEHLAMLIPRITNKYITSVMKNEAMIGLDDSVFRPVASIIDTNKGKHWADQTPCLFPR